MMFGFIVFLIVDVKTAANASTWRLVDFVFAYSSVHECMAGLRSVFLGEFSRGLFLELFGAPLVFGHGSMPGRCRPPLRQAVDVEGWLTAAVGGLKAQKGALYWTAHE